MGIEALLSTQIIDTTTVGRSVMTAIDAAAARTALGLGTLATQNGTITDYLTTAAAATTYQPLDADLTALAALTGTDNLYYRSGAATWSSVTIGTGLTFTGGTLAASGGSGISSLNGLNNDTQTFGAGTSRTDVAWVSSAGVHTLNIPSASATARGLVTTGTQTIAGAKTFSSKITAPATGQASTGGIGNAGNGIDFAEGILVYITGRGLSQRYPVYITGNSSSGSVPTVKLASDCVISWESGTDPGASPTPGPLQLARWANDHLTQRRGTNAQTFSVTNTYSSDTSFERVTIGWSANVCTITTEKGSAGGTLRGLRIGDASTALLGFYGATAIVQPGTGVASATRVGGGGTALTDTDTFDGYTIGQVVKALRNLGFLA